MTISKLGPSPAPALTSAPAPAQTPHAVQGLLAMFGEGATRRAAEAALDAHETAPASRAAPVASPTRA